MAQALELSTLADNVMVELPASREGLRVLHELTRRGISTNCGLAATVSQFVTAAEQIQAGLLKARASGVNLTAWRSVVSHLYTRWAETEAFAEEASHAGTPLSVDERSWASIAVFKEAYRIFRHRAYPTKMLLRSARPGPDSGGVRGFWPLQQMAGADGVFTVHPPSVSRFIAYHSAPSFTLQIWSPIPEHVMSKLSPLQYFQTAYQPDRTPPEAYDEIPALLDTLEEFRRASSAIEGFVQGRSGPRVGGLSHDESSVADSEE